MPSLESHLKSDPNARFDGAAVASFGDLPGEYEAALHSGAKCPLLASGLVRFAGDDAQSFINAQFTTNCLELGASQGQLSAWCDPKGRVLFLFVLFKNGTEYFAALPASQIPKFVQRLRMYVLRAAVEIDDVTADYRQIGVLHGTHNDVPTAAPWSVDSAVSGITAIRFGPGAPRTLAILSVEHALDFWLANPLACAGESAWQAINMLSGVPELDEVSSGEYLPQQLNLDHLNAVSFAKGCYPGQEIIARLKYRGEVKKRLVAATCASGDDIAGGTVIRLPDDGRNVGRVLRAVAVGADARILSAVVDVAIDWSKIVIEGHEEIELRRIDLPYADA
ncbi:MAG: CAF17-like 4Fe-4S cluster assembly/insertion protein YgfZ [Gammaproteobacteria bacterium]|jgi:folate-binding protein YgfZ